MRNISDKVYIENQNTYFVFSNISSKIAPLMRQYTYKICSRQTGHRWW